MGANGIALALAVGKPEAAKRAIQAIILVILRPVEFRLAG
jgi:hypothetical protein